MSTLPKRSDIDWITPAPIASQKFYNIAHMTNTDRATDWAMGQGANGLEMDLNFDADGNPTNFKHGDQCDCSCPRMDYDDHVCRAALGNSCDAESPAASHLNHIATLRNVAVVYIDSKVNEFSNPRGGTEVIKLLETALFEKGYRGFVIVNAPDLDNTAYIQAAARAASTSTFHDRIYFGFDQVSGSASTAIDVLKDLPGRPRVVYSTGQSACGPLTYYSQVSEAIKSQVAGEVSMTGIWTLDLERSMLNYLQLGVRAIVTNRPAVLKRVIQQRQPAVPLASPGDAPTQ